MAKDFRLEARKVIEAVRKFCDANERANDEKIRALHGRIAALEECCAKQQKMIEQFISPEDDAHTEFVMCFEDGRRKHVSRTVVTTRP